MKAYSRGTRKRTPYPHQLEGVDYSLEIGNPALLMQMRCGKTPTCIWWVQKAGLQKPLVILPLQAAEGWMQELFLEGERFIGAFNMPADKRKELLEYVWRSRERIWLLMNYEGLLVTADKNRFQKSTDEDGNPIYDTEYEIPEIAHKPWDTVVLDESPRIKSPGSVISEICLRGFRSAKHRAILTGAVQTENYFELFNQYCFLDGHFMGYRNFYHFQKSLFHKLAGSHEWIPKKGSLYAIQNYVHTRSFVRKRSDVGLKEKKIYEKRFVSMSQKQRKLYRAIEEEFTAYLLSGGRWETEYALVRRNWLAKLAGGFDAENSLVCGAKADDIIELLRGELSGEKMAIWFRYRHELEYVRERLDKAKISNVFVMGGISTIERKRRMQDFRNKSRVLLATMASLRYGVDASVCDISYYYSSSDSGDHRIQSEDRTVNPFTKDLNKSLLVIDCLTRDSVDIDIYQGNQDKVLKSKLFHLDPRKRFLRRVGAF